MVERSGCSLSAVNASGGDGVMWCYEKKKTGAKLFIKRYEITKRTKGRVNRYVVSMINSNDNDIRCRGDVIDLAQNQRRCYRTQWQSGSFVELSRSCHSCGLREYYLFYLHASQFACSWLCLCWAWTSKSKARSCLCGNCGKVSHIIAGWRHYWSRWLRTWVAWRVLKGLNRLYSR